MYIFTYIHIYILVEVELDKVCLATSLFAFFRSCSFPWQHFWCSSGYSTQPTSMMQFTTKIEWMAVGFGGGPMCGPDSWKGGFNKIIRLSSKNSWKTCFFFRWRNSWPCWQWFTLQAFLAGCIFVGWSLCRFTDGTFPDDDYQHHIINVDPCRRPHYHRPFYHLVMSITFFWYVRDLNMARLRSNNLCSLFKGRFSIAICSVKSMLIPRARSTHPWPAFLKWSSCCAIEISQVGSHETGDLGKPWRWEMGWNGGWVAEGFRWFHDFGGVALPWFPRGPVLLPWVHLSLLPKEQRLSSWL